MTRRLTLLDRYDMALVFLFGTGWRALCRVARPRWSLPVLTIVLTLAPISYTAPVVAFIRCDTRCR